jgi:uncharacterized integral membrane protein (TIGR00697 family)
MPIQSLVLLLQDLPPEIILGFEYALCALTILGMVRFFGKAGLFTYIALAVVIGNLQVLKAAHFTYLSFPVALGTIVFSSTFLASDILTEFYGASQARKAVWVGFTAYLVMTLFMILTLGIKPAPTSDDSFLAVHNAIQLLFSPAPALFMASLISYALSQYTDIWVFQAIRHLTGTKWLWLRSLISSLGSALLDNILFSTLAWVIFNPTPVSFEQLIFIYILGTYTFRIIVTLLQTPLMYGVRMFIKQDSYAKL